MNIEFPITTAFEKHQKAKTKIVISQGGGRSGKTFSILQLLILYCLSNNDKIVSVVAENIPFLKRGALRDFQNIMTTSGLWTQRRFNKSDNIYRFHTGSIMEFFSVESPGRALGSARDVLFINEGNHIHYETAFQLMARTRIKTYIDFNPTFEFWVHEEILNNKFFEDEFEIVKTTYKDNEELEKAIIDLMIARGKKDINYRRVYIEGELGSVEGVIFPNFKLINFIDDEIRDKAKQQYLSLDFGYSKDPAAICSVYILGDEKKPVVDIYVDEVLFETGYNNIQLAKVIKQNIQKNNYKVIADSSEPKSIDEIYSRGLNILPADKGPDSINYGINLMKDANIYVTKQSINLIKELRNYKWATDRYGRPQKDAKGRPVPVDIWNHCIDGIRYVCGHHHNLKFEYRDVPRRGGQSRRGLVPV